MCQKKTNTWQETIKEEPLSPLEEEIDKATKPRVIKKQPKYILKCNEAKKKKENEFETLEKLNNELYSKLILSDSKLPKGRNEMHLRAASVNDTSKRSHKTLSCHNFGPIIKDNPTQMNISVDCAKQNSLRSSSVNNLMINNIKEQITDRKQLYYKKEFLNENGKFLLFGWFCEIYR